jgi:DNA-directed RNA polymerase subunit RPC12/RpoP
MVGRKTKIPILEDMDSATIEYPCANDACTHRFRYTGKQYKKNRELSCPECGSHTVVNEDKLYKIFGERVQRTREYYKRIQKERDEK